MACMEKTLRRTERDVPISIYSATIQTLQDKAATESCRVGHYAKYIFKVFKGCNLDMGTYCCNDQLKLCKWDLPSRKCGYFTDTVVGEMGLDSLTMTDWGIYGTVDQVEIAKAGNCWLTEEENM